MTIAIPIVTMVGKNVANQLISGLLPIVGGGAISIEPVGNSFLILGDRLNWEYPALCFGPLLFFTEELPAPNDPLKRVEEASLPESFSKLGEDERRLPILLFNFCSFLSDGASIKRPPHLGQKDPSEAASPHFEQTSMLTPVFKNCFSQGLLEPKSLWLWV